VEVEIKVKGPLKFVAPPIVKSPETVMSPMVVKLPEVSMIKAFWPTTIGAVKKDEALMVSLS